ncbi:plasma-membrane calcium-translocating P-type ATPase [Paenibacillus uliginis N3/975]|uniref:P-type Ca(2+) transporter n=1 Tax=Paenibacillus uliginis N3/975 TaxID=1313296 RepID=A0A1X7GZ49_9BACL|nr:cation-translocating P-type ATPase [Paenibacillus uliginis]SMF77042.1 plasma-membrane calcium-translocating P-type ATPase [Paenibacillus uliginis N3/975]
MKWMERKLEDIFKALKTNRENGLSSKQAAEVLQQKGYNEFEEEKKEGIGAKLLHQFSEVTTIILLVAALISTYLAVTEGHGYAEPLVIIAIVALNAVLGIRQELSAEKALDALKNMNTPAAKVVRDGILQPINSKELVPGDIIMVEAGDMIPADARLIESSNLLVEESALTGESVPSEKNAQAEVKESDPLGDRVNMLFSGCLVTNGRGRAVVVATGMETEMGKIASLLNNTKKSKTPLQQRLIELGKKLSLVAVVSGVIIFGIGLLHGETIMEMLMTAVSLAVAAVPETLPVIVTVTLAFGIQNMVRKNAIIRRIPAVEALGSASVICSDKTGTLTQNQMTIKQVWAVSHEPKADTEAFNDTETELLTMFSLASNASIELNNGEETIIGDPTETAIIRLLHQKGTKKSELEAKYPRVHELPFDSSRKLMTTVHRTEDGYISITKGAFDRIPLDPHASCTNEYQARANEVHDQFAEQALRVLALGYKHYGELPEQLDAAELEQGLRFAGLVGMIDPPRPESKAAVQAAMDAGIKTVMITGDHMATASAIAREIGILKEGDLAISGAELERMSDVELKQKVRHISVYGRVSPEDKIRIVQAWQANGEVVAMTGDGVNDAPALKAADVGTAMGITGTDVAKSASDMVLTDDNFATIVDAVAEGRRVYENIRKTLYFLLSCNFSEIMIMIIAVAFGWGLPVIAIQLLLINVVADGIPGFCLSREKMEPDTMRQKPISKNAGIFSNGLGKKIALQASLYTVLTLLGFYVGKFVHISDQVSTSHEVGQTMAFVILGWSSVVHIFNVRSNTQSIFTIGFMSNRSLFWCAMLSIAIIFGIAIIPTLMEIFQIVSLSFTHWVIVTILSIVPLIVVELAKLSTRKKLRAQGQSI